MTCFCKSNRDCICCLFKDYPINQAKIYAAKFFKNKQSNTNISFKIEDCDIGSANNLCGTEFSTAKLKLFCNKFNIKIIEYQSNLYLLDKSIAKYFRRIV
ncbi:MULTISPECIES: hypothetical protein [Helicobacter]|uniref:Uncharacterized protein n=1 Tax=Helicobacter bilis ATCC 43879 TaxID=613026 RepID=T5LSA4_9HELI|nr:MULTISPECIES: hypothetical protein [Helicobacter]EQM94651.1 hypothetical protein HRAG_02306 [Helicobacter bilis ATCC 43879]